MNLFALMLITLQHILKSIVKARLKKDFLVLVLTWTSIIRSSILVFISPLFVINLFTSVIGEDMKWLKLIPAISVALFVVPKN